ncbi:XRE family transcriptional regulator [Deltaproteobacteria bacterium Smac51]|nr:XRE family transcriptional regulator [Deltaproteobacteria bacterium Smac51]
MIRLRVLEIITEQGKSKYSINKHIGMSAQNFNKMLNNETKSIKYENIETLCLLLNCTPNDLFEIDSNKPEESLPPKKSQKSYPKK